MDCLLAQADSNPNGAAVLFVVVVIFGLVAFFNWLFDSKPKGAVIHHRSRTDITPK